jgi:hypothetical protein
LNELKLSIEQIDPAVLWGPNNDHFEIIKKQYPKLKLVARGSEVKVLGDEHELAIFQEKFDHLVQHVEKFDSLNVNDVERILGQGLPPRKKVKPRPISLPAAKFWFLAPTVLWLGRVRQTSTVWLIA